MDYFQDSELKCKCGCGLMNFSNDLRERLSSMRYLLKKPIIVTSGCRCKEHNKNVGGKTNSAHITGKAVDIKCSNNADRFELYDLARLVQIKRMGLSKNNFMHLDIDETKPDRRLWLY